MHVGILGAAEAHLAGVPVDLGTRKQRALLAALALHRGRAVSADALVDLLWGAAPPAAVIPTLQGYVARLRRAVEPGRAPRAEPQVLLTRDDGYLLDLPGDALDAHRFETAVTGAHDALGTGLVVRGLAPADLARSHEDLDGALALWRGVPYAELDDAEEARVERGRLEELRLIALEDRAAAALALGRHATAAGELESLTARHPLRERLWGLRALALTRSGRQAEALDVLRQVRDLLAEELGLEPGAELRELQTAVLRQDPALEWVAPRDSTPARRSPPADGPPAAWPSAAAGPAEPAWPLIGRDDQLAALVGLVERPTDTPVFAALTGEAGIGKTRLSSELATLAEQGGTTVLFGRCSQDEGAPPLYPWAGVLRALGAELPSVETGGPEEARASFRAWERIVGTVLDAARRRPLLVVLDDLHWADVSTLRVLRLLAETASSGRLMVLSTWRHEPPPSGQLAVVADMLARRHALRLHLEGLSTQESAEIVTSVGATTPTTTEADALRSRTDGNPFFLVEYARLAGDSGDLGALLAEEHPPAAVSDVLTRRVGGLPNASVTALRAASVLGRDFDVRTLAAVLGESEDAVVDDLEAALSAGLLRESAVDRYRFAHALVRDTVYSNTSRTRRGRIHAAAAEVLSDVPARESDVARHWLAAGARHVRQGWQAAVVAAERACRVYAYEDAVELLRQSAEALGEDPLATPLEEADVLLRLGRTLQLAGNWLDLRPAVHRLIQLARELDDLELLVEACVLPSEGALWQSAHHGTVDEVIAGGLRHALERLPTGDDERRCRVMLGLSSELYYSASPQEREALAEEGLAMATRLGDPRLRLHCCLVALISVWRPATATLRLRLADEAIGLAEAMGERTGASSALTSRAVALHELGRVEEMDHAILLARRVAEEERHLYGRLVLAALGVTWAAARGDVEQRDRLLADMMSVSGQMSLAQMDDAVTGAVVSQLLWTGEFAQIAAALEASQPTSLLPLSGVRAALLARAGRTAEAVALVDAEDPLHGVRDDWFGLLVWAMCAELSLRLQRPELAARSYELLSDLAGRPACAGSGVMVGPVDAFLAMAAAAVGETDLAARHADRAAHLCEQWQAAPAGAWLAGVRSELGF